MALAASFILITYNQRAYVRDALLSILEQDMDNLEVVISDDASSDGTWDIITQIVSEYRGNKVIKKNRNNNNLGLLGNYFKAVSLTSADLIFCGAGDDISLPNRCSETIRYWQEKGSKADLVAADGYDMAVDGSILGVKKTDNLEKWTPEMWARKRPYFFGASHMLTRSLIELAPLNPKLPYEDQCFVFRAILLGGALRLPMPLVMHRRGGISQPVLKVEKRKLGYLARKRRWLRDSTLIANELAQMSADAILLGRDDVCRCFKQESDRCSFIKAIFSEDRFFRIIGVFVGNGSLPIRKRIRYFRYALVSWLLERFMSSSS